MDFISEVIHTEDIPRILVIKISKTGRRDGYCWKHTKSGAYTVKSGYDIAVEQRKKQSFRPIEEPSTISLKQQVWKLKTARKIKHFLWQASTGCVESASKLVERHCGSDSTCQWCGAETENINHILFECPPALQLWALSPIPSAPGVFLCTSLFTDYLLNQAGTSLNQMDGFSIFPWLLWYIWKARNKKCFNGKDTAPPDTLSVAAEEAEAWRLAQIDERVEV